MSRTFKAAQLDEIVMRYRQAKDPEKQIPILADMFVCSKDDIRRVLGLECEEKRRAARWTPEETAQLLHLRREGMTLLQIAKIMERSESSIRQRVFKMRQKEKARQATT